MTTNLHLSSSDLATIIEALKKPRAEHAFPGPLWSAIRQQRWVRHVDVSDLVTSMDVRCARNNLDRLASAAGLQAREVHQIQRNPRDQRLVTSRLAVTDVGALCILLDRLGFSIDASQIAQDLKADIKQDSVVTVSEGDLFWFDHNRHRSEIRIQASDVDTSIGILPDADITSHRWKGVGGHRYECLSFGGRIVTLVVREWKYRVPRSRTITCATCGFGYTLGDRDSVSEHRSVHATTMKTHSPTPTKRMLERLRLGPSGERVDAGSPLWMHHEMYARAAAFHQEFRYDHIQWPVVRDRTCVSAMWAGYVLSDTAGAIDGGCAFLNRSGRWAMQWIWIRPGRRRNGLLAARWQHFINVFGDFEIEAPFSTPMLLFFERYGTSAQKELMRQLHPEGIPVENPH